MGSKTGHRAGALGPGLGALVGLVLGLDWTSFAMWPAVIGVLQIRKRPQIGLIFWVFWELSCLLSMTWDMIVKDSLSRLKKMNKVPSSIFSPEFQFLRAQNQSLRRGLRACI